MMTHADTIFCTCHIPLVPLHPDYQIRPTPNCLRHQILAERWDAIKTRRDYEAAMEADKQRIADLHGQT